MSKEPLHIIKVGGAVLEDAQKRSEFIDEFTSLEGLKILVHGGGRSATVIGEQLGVKAQMVHGKRVTNAETLDVVTMVYAGLVNKQLVASLQSKGVNALGLSGADGNVIKAKKRDIEDGVDYGFVGKPVQVNTQLLSSFLGEQVTPVMAPLTHDGAGRLLNTNADTIAGSLAMALAELYEVHLSLTFELSGVLRDVNDEASLIQKLDKGQYESMKANGEIHSGMIPKLDNAFSALEAGAQSVRICKYDQLKSTNGSFLQI